MAGTSSTAEPAWPIGYPCVALSDWTPKPAERDGVQIFKGDECIVLQTSTLRGQADGLMRVSIRRRKVAGWTYKNQLSTPGQRKVGDIEIITNYSSRDRLHFVNPLPPQLRGFFHKVVCYQVEALIKVSAQLPTENTKLNRQLEVYGGINGIADAIIAAIDACPSASGTSMLAVLNNPRLTIDDLWNAGQPITGRSDNRDGDYMRIYRDFTNQPERLPELYIGQATGFGARLSSHTTFTNKEKKTRDSNHYKAARKASQYKMFAFAETQDIGLRTIIEQLFMGAFRTYVPVLRGYDIPPGEDRTLVALENHEKWQDDAHAAEVISRAADEASRACGFNAGCGRPGFGSAVGLNWSSPMNQWEIFKPYEYIRQDPNRDMATFRRAVRPWDDRNQRIFFSKSSSDAHFRLEISRDRPNIPKAGQKAYFVAEVRLDGKPHKYSWARLSTVGTFTQWNDAAGIAFKIEYEDEDDDDKYKAFYVQSQGSTLLRDEAVPGSFRTYSLALAMRRYLLQQKMPNRLPWMDDLGKAHVRHVVYDHQEQQVRVRDHPIGSVIPAPVRRPWGEMRVELLRAGVRSFGNIPYGFDKENHGRKSCDHCRLGSTGQIGPCNPHEHGSNSQVACDFCLKIGRLECSWTPSDRFWGPNGVALRQAIDITHTEKESRYNPPLNPIFEIEDPGMQDI